MKKSVLSTILLLVVIACCVIIFATTFPVKKRKFVASVCDRYNLKLELVYALINVESGWDASARSSSGAVGVMQVMPSTADEVATKLDMGEYDLTNFEDNVQIGCYYLRYLLDMFDDEKLALCAYNAGPNTVRLWLADERYVDDGDLKTIPYKETKNYIKKIQFNKKVYAILL